MSSLNRILAIIKKGFKLGPKNPVFLIALAVPLIYTLIMQVLFGGFWKTKPVIVVYDKSGQEVVRELKKSDAIKTIEAKEVSEVKDIVEEKKADVGIVFPKNLAEKLKGKDKMSLKFLINGESLAKDRNIAGITVLNTLREFAPEGPQVDFKQVNIGNEKALTLLELFLPFIVIVTVLINAFFLPAAFVIQEKERKTLASILVSPSSYVEVLVAFGFMGVVLAIFMGMVMLLVNFGLNQPFMLLIPIFLGSLLMAEWGLVAGIMFKDTNALFANVKMMGIIFYAPAILLMFENVPKWIAKLFPTYYIANPVFRISIYNEGWAQIGWEIYVLIALVVVFFIPLTFLGKRLGTQT